MRFINEILVTHQEELICRTIIIPSSFIGILIEAQSPAHESCSVFLTQLMCCYLFFRSMKAIYRKDNSELILRYKNILSSFHRQDVVITFVLF